MVNFLLSCFLFAYPCASVTRLLSFLSPSCAADELAAANARISSLEAELEASRKAWDAATAAKTTAEKSHKSALARAKKAEKALADANKEHIQRDQAVTECLNRMSALAGGKYHALPFFVELRKFIYLLICTFPLSSPPWLFVEHTGCLRNLCSRTMTL
jgi:septal ring factor EnvC (AmiA/AmiB activator)